jgi:predicted RNA-binding protein associated with RNAse of E/G family
MPVGMMRLSTATPVWLEQFRDDPEGLERYIESVLAAVEADRKPTLKDLYFDIGRERAYAVIENLDDYVAVKAVARVLGAEGFLKLVTTAQAAEAVAQANTILGQSGSTSS